MLQMLSRSLLCALTLVAAIPASVSAQVVAPGSEAETLADRVGRWAVTETVWDRPGAAPAINTHLVAERRMVGNYLEEQMLAVNGAASGVERIDYLGFDHVAGRWDYLSLDARVAVPLMPAWSFDRGIPGRIVVDFAPFALPGSSTSVTGQMLRMQEVITQDGPDHDTKDQWFILADGSGRKWLAHRYDYARQH
jgi:hypothetical protein